MIRIFQVHFCTLFLNSVLQLGVSNVDELAQALGTREETQERRQSASSTSTETKPEKSTNQDDVADELVYTDSSTFLKVFHICKA